MSAVLLLATAVVALHLCVVLFVAGGLPLIITGNLLGWRWVNFLWFRALHLLAIAYVAAQSWFDIVCPLTTLEMWLRARAGQATHGNSFVGHWMQRLLYYDAPPWVFMVAYTAFAGAVAATWWIFPPQKRATASRTPG